MSNWEDELKKYIVKKFKAKVGIDIVIEDLVIDISNIDLPNVDIDDLAIIYAFAISDEDFEKADTFLTEVKKRGYLIIIDTNDAKKSGSVKVIDAKKSDNVICEVKMKITPNGMIIDFEEQNF